MKTNKQQQQQQKQKTTTTKKTQKNIHVPFLTSSARIHRHYENVHSFICKDRKRTYSLCFHNILQYHT